MGALPAVGPEGEYCCDMTTEAGGVITEGGPIAEEAKPPFDCEFIEGYGGEVGVLG